MALLAARLRSTALVSTVRAALCLLLLAQVSTRVVANQPGEEDVKAAYLYNFTRFVTWPREAIKNGAPFRVCVVAGNHMTRVIERTMQGELVGGRPVATVVPRDAGEARLCQILFIGQEAAERGRTMLSAVRGLPVLTVGETGSFLRHGGAIEFVMEQTKVRFDINPASAERVGLSISSRLLNVARNAEAVKR